MNRRRFTPRVPARRILAGLVATAITVTATITGPLAPPSEAQPPSGFVDLVRLGTYYHLSQVDRRWAPLAIVGDEPIGKCGCQLTALAALLGHYTGAPATTQHRAQGLADPLFASTIVDTSYKHDWPYTYTKVLSTHEEPVFSPYYLHKLLERNGGYDNGGCGAGVAPWALADSAIPKSVQTAGGDVRIGPEGIGVDYRSGFDRQVVDAGLANGRPTIVGRAIVDPETGSTRHHVNIITGYDPYTGHYLWVDPIVRTGVPNSTSIWGQDQKSQEAYANWEGSIITTIDTYPVSSPRDHTVLTPTSGGAGLRSTAAAATVDVELGAVLPDGTLVGYDPATGDHHQFRANFDWDLFTATPVDGPAEPAAPRRTAGLMTTDVGTGVLRTRIVPTESGDYAVRIRDLKDNGAVDTDLAVVVGTGVAGAEIKHEIAYAEDGSAVVTEVEDFTPEVVVAPISGVAGTAVELDAAGSFDVDDAIATIAWDFGDGSTGTGRTPRHTWVRPGTYPVAVTVTSTDGTTATETVTATIAPSETEAPTVSITAAPDGWTAASSVTVTAIADDGDGSGVESVTIEVGEEATTTAGHRATATITAEGRTLVGAVATDRMGNAAGGPSVEVLIDRTAPTADVMAPASGRPVRSLAFLTGGADDGDGSGIDQVEVQVRDAAGAVVGDGWRTASGDDTWWLADDDLSSLPDGAYEVRARATDHAGNVSPAGSPVAVTVSGSATGGAEVLELLPVKDGADSIASAVTDAGEAAGTMTGLGIREGAVRWSATGSATELPALPSYSAGAHAEGRSPDGDTAVGWSQSSIGQLRATAWIGGSPIDLGTVNGGPSEAHGVNDAGLAVGASSVDGRQRSRATAFEDGHARFLPDLGGGSSAALAVNAAGVAVGWSAMPGRSVEQAFLTDGVTAVALTGATGDSQASTAWDIAEDGTVVGNHGNQAVRWRDGTEEVLYEGEARAVAATGAVVGTGADGTAVLWHDGALTDLNALVDPTAGWILRSALDISADGTTIVGYGERFGTVRGFRIVLGDGAGETGDDDAPTTEAVVTPTVPAGGWTNQATTLTLTAEDGDGAGVDRIEVAGAPSAAGSSRSLIVETEGVHRIAWAAIDEVGNVETPPGSAVVRIDRTAPSAAIEPAAGWARGPVTVQTSGTDTGGSGIAAIDVTVDGTESDVVAGDGSHEVTAVPTDRAGNVGPAATATVRIDATAPTIGFGFEDGPITTGTAAAFAVTDATSGVGTVIATVIDANGARVVNSDEALTTPGPTVIQVMATDVAGNVAVAVRTVVVGEDGPIERVPFGSVPVAHAGGPYTAALGEAVTFDGTRSTDADGDTLTYEWSVDHLPLTTGPTPTVALLEPGVHTVSLVVHDGTQQSLPVFTTLTVTERAATTLTASPVLLRLRSLTLFLGIFEARLTDAAGAPVAGEPVRFEVLGRTRCTAVTNNKGVARCEAQLADALLAILVPYTARYDGDEARLPSTGQARLVR